MYGSVQTAIRSGAVWLSHLTSGAEAIIVLLLPGDRVSKNQRVELTEDQGRNSGGGEVLGTDSWGGATSQKRKVAHPTFFRSTPNVLRWQSRAILRGNAGPRHSTACRKPTPTLPSFRSRPCPLRSASTSFHREKLLPSWYPQFCLPFSTWLKSCASSPA